MERRNADATVKNGDSETETAPINPRGNGVTRGPTLGPKHLVAASDENPLFPG